VGLSSLECGFKKKEVDWTAQTCGQAKERKYNTILCNVRGIEQAAHQKKWL
jgi:hypothetical protein